jgi:hypothetical protein
MAGTAIGNKHLKISERYDVRRGSRASSVVRPIATRIETSAGRANGTHLIRNFRNIAFRLTQISRISAASRPTEGRLAIVTDAGRDAVDADGAGDEQCCCGRRSRVVLTPRRWRQVCGMAMSALTGLTRRAGDGDKQARSPGRARRKPLKPLRGECRVISGVTVVTNARVYYTPRAAAGAPGARHSLRPLIQKAEFLAQLGRTVSRERRFVSRSLTSLRPVGSQ